MFKAVHKLLTRWSSLHADAPLRPRERRRRFELSREPDCIYAIGDIHGCMDKLRSLEQAIVEDAQRVQGSKLLVFLGDYIDRGPDSARVIDHLMAPPPTGFQRVCLCGNHEEVLVNLYDDRRRLGDWLQLGGDRTLFSYGYDFHYMTAGRTMSEAAIAQEMFEAIPAEHLRFLRQLPAAFSTPSFFFAHAGARPGVALADQSEHDLLWIRDAFLTAAETDFGRMVIHGHTPTSEPFVGPRRIGIDTGAYMGGPLTAVRLMGGQADFLVSR